MLRCYGESCARLFREVPELGGINLIVGGEGLMHCFTRPKPPLRGGTNCPHCRGRNPSRDVARLVNAVASAVHKVKREAKVFAWPYSADHWAGTRDKNQLELIEHLRRDVSFLSNFETPVRVRRGSAEAHLCDYNILNMGPSTRFAAQTRALRAKGMAHYAKTESAVTVFHPYVPYIPVPSRWFERFRRIRAHGAAGILAKWNFYGLTGSVPEQLLCEFVWEESPRLDDALARIARRDFGDVDATAVVRAWKKLGDAWDHMPLSHLMFGGRRGALKGPFWLGPAHPLILDPQKDYGLSRKFVTADAPKPFARTARKCTQAEARMTFVSDLFYTLPFGPGEGRTGHREDGARMDARRRRPLGGARQAPDAARRHGTGRLPHGGRTFAHRAQRDAFLPRARRPVVAADRLRDVLQSAPGAARDRRG